MSTIGQTAVKSKQAATKIPSPHFSKQHLIFTMVRISTNLFKMVCSHTGNGMSTKVTVASI